MIRSLLIALFISKSLLLFSQSDTTHKVEKFPEFRGSTSAMYRFISDNIFYPKVMLQRSNPIEGKVLVRFVIDTNGKVFDIEIVKGLHPLLDSEAVAVVKKFNIPGNEWTPGMQDNKKVKVKFILPVKFSADESNETFTSSEEFKKSNKISSIDRATPFYYAGTKKLELKDYKGAVQDYDSTLKNVPYYLDALYNRGVAKYNLKDIQGACIDWRKIRSLGHPDADDFLSKFCK
jgi:protein TonB